MKRYAVVTVLLMLLCEGHVSALSQDQALLEGGESDKQVQLKLDQTIPGLGVMDEYSETNEATWEKYGLIWPGAAQTLAFAAMYAGNSMRESWGAEKCIPQSLRQEDGVSLDNTRITARDAFLITDAVEVLVQLLDPETDEVYTPKDGDYMEHRSKLDKMADMFRAEKMCKVADQCPLDKRLVIRPLDTITAHLPGMIGLMVFDGYAENGLLEATDTNPIIIFGKACQPFMHSQAGQLKEIVKAQPVSGKLTSLQSLRMSSHLLKTYFFYMNAEKSRVEIVAQNKHPEAAKSTFAALKETKEMEGLINPYRKFLEKIFVEHIDTDEVKAKGASRHLINYFKLKPRKHDFKWKFTLIVLYSFVCLILLVPFYTVNTPTTESTATSKPYSFKMRYTFGVTGVVILGSIFMVSAGKLITNGKTANDDVDVLHNVRQGYALCMLVVAAYIPVLIYRATRNEQFYPKKDYDKMVLATVGVNWGQFILETWFFAEKVGAFINSQLSRQLVPSLGDKQLMDMILSFVTFTDGVKGFQSSMRDYFDVDTHWCDMRMIRMVIDTKAKDLGGYDPDWGDKISISCTNEPFKKCLTADGAYQRKCTWDDLTNDSEIREIMSNAVCAVTCVPGTNGTVDGKTKTTFTNCNEDGLIGSRWSIIYEPVDLAEICGRDSTGKVDANGEVVQNRMAASTVARQLTQ